MRAQLAPQRVEVLAALARQHLANVSLAAPQHGLRDGAAGDGSVASALAISAPVMPPHTRHSPVEFGAKAVGAVQRHAAASPAAQMPGIRVAPSMSVSMPPIE